MVADYVASRLREQGVDTLFGVPGVTCVAMFEAAIKQGISTVVNSSDLEAGYAADVGKACVRFKSLEDLPIDLVGEVISLTPVDRFIEVYEASRKR